MDGVGESDAAVLIVVELVPAGAAGAEQEHIAGAHVGDGCLYCVFQGLTQNRPTACCVDDGRAGCADAVQAGELFAQLADR